MGLMTESSSQTLRSEKVHSQTSCREVIIMRYIAISILLGLSACASVPGDSDISARTASWQGAPADELVAALGQPNINKRGTWVWEFAGPERHEGGDHSNHSTHTESLSVVQACSDCTPGQGMTRSSGRPQSSVPSVCTYLGYVEHGVVNKLTTLSEPGTHCTFQELPLRVAE